MRVVIVGCGSIGLRHATLASAAGHDVMCVTRRNDIHMPHTAYLQEALQKPADLVIIASPTDKHGSDLSEIHSVLTQNTSRVKRILVEKPLYALASQAPGLPGEDQPNIFVAYNLRFHPGIRRLHSLLAGKILTHISFYAGQYLPDWRPGTDYRTCYSAVAEQGGGVLRDLSHELDLACYFSGPWQRMTALGGRFSELEISSDDTFTILSQHAHCASVCIHLNYLDRIPRREMVVQYSGGSAYLDLINNTLLWEGQSESFAVERNTTYQVQLDAMLGSDEALACTYAEGLELVRFIEAAEKAAKERQWINR